MINEVFTGSKAYLKNNLFELHKSLFSSEIYDQNFMFLKRSPNINEFLKTEDILVENCINNFLLFKLNFDLIPNDILLNLIQSKNYSINKLLVYTVNQKIFKYYDTQNIGITINPLSKNTHVDFLDLKWKQDIEYGEIFALQNRKFMIKMLETNSINYFLAKKGEKIVGLISTIEHPDNIEIYDLYVLPNFRGNNIATALQKKAINSYDKNFIVIADNSDTPKFMYQKLGYQQIHFWYEFQKEL